MDKGSGGQEGHARFHLGIDGDGHRIAVDAFKHQGGGFTLAAVDALNIDMTAKAVARLEKKNSDLIKGSLLFLTPNQIPKPKKEPSLLDMAEAVNPDLKTQALNKRGQTLRQRFASLNPAIDPENAAEEFSRADRTLSLDKKRLLLIDRAIMHYMDLV